MADTDTSITKAGTEGRESARKGTIAERLEQIRNHLDIKSRRAFWKRIVTGWDRDKKLPSYPGIKLWHTKLDPPVDYLARVIEVWPDVRLEYLVFGTGHMTHSEQRAAESAKAVAHQFADERMRDSADIEGLLEMLPSWAMIGLYNLYYDLLAVRPEKMPRERVAKHRWFQHWFRETMKLNGSHESDWGARVMHLNEVAMRISQGFDFDDPTKTEG